MLLNSVRWTEYDLFMALRYNRKPVLMHYRALLVKCIHYIRFNLERWIEYDLLRSLWEAASVARGNLRLCWWGEYNIFYYSIQFGEVDRIWSVYGAFRQQKPSLDAIQGSFGGVNAICSISLGRKKRIWSAEGSLGKEENSLSCNIKLFCRCSLSCENAMLCCGNAGLFCGDTWLLCGNACLFCTTAALKNKSWTLSPVFAVT